MKTSPWKRSKLVCPKVKGNLSSSTESRPTTARFAMFVPGCSYGGSGQGLTADNGLSVANMWECKGREGARIGSQGTCFERLSA